MRQSMDITRAVFQQLLNIQEGRLSGSRVELGAYCHQRRLGVFGCVILRLSTGVEGLAEPTEAAVRFENLM